jgi:hypothetical protein
MEELWAIGRYDLQLSEEDFWRLTLKEFNMLCHRHRERRRAELFNSALICSVIANVHRGKGKPYKPDDFMPKEKTNKKMTTEEMVEMLKAITLANGGEVKC